MIVDALKRRMHRDVVANPAVHAAVLNLYLNGERYPHKVDDYFPIAAAEDATLAQAMAAHAHDEDKHVALYAKAIEKLGHDVVELPDDDIFNHVIRVHTAEPWAIAAAAVAGILGVAARWSRGEDRIADASIASTNLEAEPSHPALSLPGPPMATPAALTGSESGPRAPTGTPADRLAAAASVLRGCAHEAGHEAAPDAGHEAAPKASAARSRSSRVHSGLGRAFDKYAQKSPTLRRNIKKLQQTGWHIKYGKKGGGSYCDKGQKVIVVDRAEKKSPMEVMQTMAHETGHALYTADPYVGPEGLSKKQYVAANVRRQLRDEGEATIMNMQIRRELLKRTHGHMDIGVAGRQANRYKRLFERYRSRLGNPKVRDKLRTRIGNIFADHEHPSTDPSKTYRQNYSEFWSDTYDKNVNNAPSSDPNQAPDPELDEGHGPGHAADSGHDPGPAEPTHSH